MKTINPYNNELVKELENHNRSDVQKALGKAQQAFDDYKKSAFPVRSRRMKAVAEQLEKKKKKYAKLMTLEMGKPIQQSVAEIEKCAWLCRYYAEHVKLFLKDEEIKTSAEISYINFEPLGAVLGIMPWNFPFWQVFRYGVPALMAGNVCLLKHAPNVPQCALEIEKIFKKAGFSDGIFQTLLVPEEEVTDIIAHDVVQGVSVTGSVRAGSAVAAEAGKNIKQTVLELGGSDPFIVLDDANVKQAAEVGAQSRMMNSGQSCIAAKRFIVEEVVYDDFLEHLSEHVKNLIVGDPTKKKVDIGPLAREDLAEKLKKQVDDSVKNGANVHYGGGRPDHAGAFYNPTILTDIEKGMPAYEQELFGPVASVFKVKNTDEAIALANDTEYGLGGSVWTVDKDKGRRLAKQVNAGNVFVNSLVKSDPRLPFGGIKKSGYGRELSYIGIKEFTNPKTIWVD